MHLRVEHGAPKAVLARILDQELQHAAPDARAAALGHDCHPPDFDVIIMREHPAASDGAFRLRRVCRSCTFERERMNGTRVIGVEFYLLGHVLLFDKHAPAKRPRLLHTHAVAADLNDSERRRNVHRISTSARPAHRQTAP